MITCLSCGASRGLRTRTVYLLSSGARRRLRHCRHCGSPVRTIQPPGEAERIAQARLLTRPRHRSTKLTAEQVVSIRHAFARGERMRPLAERYGVRRQAIEQIVNGQTWASAGGPIRQRKRCEDCTEWRGGGCSFGFPEAGGAFAGECELYSPRSQSISRACPISDQ